jgi:flagellar M-ring protein FliF
MNFKELLTQLSKEFLKLNTNQKIIVGASLLAVVGFLIFLVIVSTAEDKSYGYKPLFEGVPYQEAGKVVEALKQNGIEYSIEEKNNNLATIKVANEDLPKARIHVSELGLPKDTRVGFELFNEQEFGATDFDQKIKYLRAIEGELSKTIELLDPISSAKVHIALPQDSLFVARQVKPTASVVISLRESMILQPKQVKGIQHLVASSVPKLSPEDVSIVNSFGEDLGDGDDISTSSEEAKIQMSYKNRYEKLYENKIVEVLAPFIGGTERVVAKVTIEFDFSREESQSEYFDPESVIRSEQSLEELREGSSPKDIGGVPGAVSNIGPVQGLNGEDKEKYEKSKATTNYEISKTVSSKKAEFSRIRRITAAVVVDGTYQKKKDENGKDTNEWEYLPLEQTQLDAIQGLVVQAIGINLERGDEVSVRNFQFKSVKDHLDRSIVMETWQDRVQEYLGPFENIIKYIIAGIILFIFYRKVVQPFAFKMLEEVKEDDDDYAYSLANDEELEEDINEKYSAMKKNIENSLGLDNNFNEDSMKYDILLERISAYISENPEDVSDLFQILIDEENGDDKTSLSGADLTSALNSAGAN